MTVVRNILTDNWDQQQKIFYDNLLAIRNKPGKTAIHDWRVAVKKLRSYLRLRELITGEKWKEEFAGIKKLFEIMGRYRDVEMSLFLFDKYGKKNNLHIPSFRKQLKSTLAITRTWIKKAVAGFDENVLNSLSLQVHSSLLIFSNEESEVLIKEQVKNKSETARSLTGEFRKNAHEIRKLLKDIYYWLKLLPANAVLNETEMKQLDKILDCLGKWQDHFVFDKKLKWFRKEYLVKETDEFKEAEKLKLLIKEAKEKLLAEAEEKFHQLFKEK